MTDADVLKKIQDINDRARTVSSRLSQAEDACIRSQHFQLVTEAEQAYTILGEMRENMKHLFGF